MKISPRLGAVPKSPGQIELTSLKLKGLTKKSDCRYLQTVAAKITNWVKNLPLTVRDVYLILRQWISSKKK